MDAELKAKWVAALRSGRFRQARTALRKGRDSYCCLGVLCRVDGQRFVRDWIGDWTVDDDSALLSDSLLVEYGLTDNQQRNLSDMNDSGKSFAEIADFIEANL